MALPLCPFCGDKRCFTDRHHIYHPRRAYRTPLEREFRSMFIEVMWRCQHERIHRENHPPRKPRRKVMQRVVDARKGAERNARELQRM